MKNFKYIVILFFLITRPGYGIIRIDREANPVEYTLKFTYTKLSDKTIRLEAEFSEKSPSGNIPISDKSISFFAEDTHEILLGEVQTGSSGIAILDISPGYKLPWNEDNQCLFKARILDDQKEKLLEETRQIKNVNMEFKFHEEDGDKYVNIYISEPGSDGAAIPVYDAEVYAYIKRLYSLYEFGADYSDEEGNLVFEFPKDMPGDDNGNLNVIVKIVESDEYGNLEQAQTIDWGTPVSFAPVNDPKTLWTDEAPLWMILAVIATLGGAWFNFFLAFSRMMKIRKLK